ncbi:MAG: ABC transporter ATP-binding protein [Actinobacteria bacterium]|nr:ABC transporter ATP-binding protein [Actinomycetota bacterium]
MTGSHDRTAPPGPTAAGEAAAVLSVNGLTKTFATAGGPKKVLRDVSFTVPAGTWVSVMGRSGSGKSTLLKCASGLLGCDSGSVVVDGVDVLGASQDDLARFRRQRLGFVFQDYNLVESLTARENIALPLLLARSADVGHRVDEALAVTGMADSAGQTASTLSGGEQQRVAIARALAQRPAVLFADEPTGALDSVNSRVVLDLFSQLTRQGTSVLMVTHDLDAAAHGDRVLVLADGRVMVELDAPTADELFSVMSQSAP